MRLGQMLCAGLETAFLQSPEAATATLRWPHPKFYSVLLPTIVPWCMDSNFAKCADRLTAPLSPTSVAARLAFAQQDQVEAPFRSSFMHALNDPRVSDVLDFAEHWRDGDDTEEWLHISAEEIDREMSVRQAEFDAYDKKVAAASSSASSKAGTQAASEGIAPDAEKLQKEVAAMGQQISSLLEQQSGAAGVDIKAESSKTSASSTVTPAERDSDSDASADDDEVLDVLGMEDGDDDSEDSDNGDAKADGGEFRTYLSELDEQLAGTLDADAAEQGADAKGGSLPLTSHHVRVHDRESVELDVHAMEHLLASFCSEQQLEPGPASLLLGELGIAKGGATSGAAASTSSSGRKASGAGYSALSPSLMPADFDTLDGMD